MTQSVGAQCRSALSQQDSSSIDVLRHLCDEALDTIELHLTANPIDEVQCNVRAV
jgi:hypothetical protein